MAQKLRFNFAQYLIFKSKKVSNRVLARFSGNTGTREEMNRDNKHLLRGGNISGYCWIWYIDSVIFKMMPKKEATNTFCKKLRRTITFWGAKIDKKFFTKSGQFLLLIKKIKISATLDPPNRRWGPFFNQGAPKIVVFSRKSAVYPQYECRSNTT